MGVGEAFGDFRVLPESSIVMNLRFSGQYHDDKSGSHYNFHRDYNPYSGRYIQSDPIGMDAGVNYYNYSYGAPLRYIDSTGEVPVIALPALCCVGFPKICREIMRCIINPKACKRKLCRFGDDIYFACHTFPTCKPCAEPCVASQGKMVFF